MPFNLYATFPATSKSSVNPRIVSLNRETTEEFSSTLLHSKSAFLNNPLF